MTQRYERHDDLIASCSYHSLSPAVRPHLGVDVLQLAPDPRGQVGHLTAHGILTLPLRELGGEVQRFDALPPLLLPSCDTC